MIPDKIYVQPLAVMTKARTQPEHDDDIEYTRTPIPKKFSEVKPENDGEYFAMAPYYIKFLPPVDTQFLGNYVVSPWMNCWYADGKWYDPRGAEFVPKYWSEIILPIVEE